MNQQQNQPPTTTYLEGVDLEKLRIMVRRNLIWIALIFLVVNLTAYLTIRWTKEIFESESEIKLDIKSDASDLGIKPFVEDQNVNLVSGEIEQIRSKLFLNRVIDSLQLWVSYYSVGQVLVDEMYKRSHFNVQYQVSQARYYDVPILFNFTEEKTFQIRIGEKSNTMQGTLGEKLVTDGLELTITGSPFRENNDNNDYSFVINSRAKLLEELSRELMVEPINYNANTIRIAFKDKNASKAYDIVNAIDSLYLQYSNERNNLAGLQKIQWLNDELGDIEQKMEGFENYFESFTIQNKSNNINDELKKTIQVINELDSQRYQVNKRLFDLNILLNGINSDNFHVGLIQRQALPLYLNNRLEDLQNLKLEKDRLSLAYNENTFAFKRKERDYVELKDQLFEEMQDLKKSMMNTAVELKQRKDQLEKRFASMPDKNTQFSKNQRYYKLYEEFYLSLMKSKAEFEIAQAGNTPDFTILSSATLPVVPIAPNRMMIVGFGVAGGLAMCFAFITILYLANNKISTIKEIEQVVSVPILGILPSTPGVDDSPFYVMDNPRARLSEAVRSLRTNLDFFTSVDNRKTLAISSTVSGEGKSFLALNLSGVLALSKKKVAILDLDLRKTNQNFPFKASNEAIGISTVLIRKHTWQECLVKTNLENLDFFPSGPVPPNPSELLLNGEFELLLTNLKSQYDFIVMDTPPIGLVTDGIMAMKRADLCIFVLRANYSRRDYLNTLKRLVNINKLTNLAVVLNASPTVANNGYGYYEEEKKKFRFSRLFKV